MEKKRQYRFLISSIDAFGHINCVLGFGELLASFGHQVTFAHRSRYKKLAYARQFNFIPFDETLYDDSMPFYETWSVQNGHLFPLDSIAAYSNWSDEDKKNYAEILGDMFTTNDALMKIFASCKDNQFDAFIGDCVMRFPAFYKSKFPCINLLSTNPIALYPDAPPYFSGLSIHAAKHEHQQFKAVFEDAVSSIRQQLQCWWSANSIPPLEEANWWFDEPRYLGFYHYPEQLDYSNDVGPLRSDKWHRVDLAIRKPDSVGSFKVPNFSIDSTGKLIYVSLGSLASANVTFMRKVIDILADSPHRFIVSKGPNGDEIELAPNMWGQNYVNQLTVLDLVDLVITHGGNNTFLETIHAGKPMIVIPVFLDQIDNAARAVDCGIGSRLDFGGLTKEKVLKTIEDTLSDKEMNLKIGRISASMRSSKSREKAVEIIENFLAKSHCD